MIKNISKNQFSFAFAFILLSFSIISSTLPIQTYAESTPIIITSTPRTLKLTTPIMQGNDVKALQTFLNSSGYKVGIADGIFGPKTQSAVKLFQTAKNLTPDGLVGPMTRGIMNSSPIAKTVLTTGQPSILQSTAGCAGTNLFNTITGVSCKTLSILPTGCTSTTNYFSTTTGLSCVRSGFTVPHDIIYSLTYTAGSNGTLTGDLSQKVEQKNHGTMVTAVPNTGYHFVNWSDLSTTNPRTDTNITTNKSVTANFEVDAPNTFTVGTSAGSNGSISPSSRTVDDGLTTTFTVTPDSGYSASLSGCDGSLVETTYTTGAITGACTVSATFAPISYTITFDSAGGTAVSSITADYGTPITSPSDPTKAGYTFAGWSPSILGTMPVGGQSLIATWGANDNTVSFNGNGNTGGSTTAQSIQTGNTAVLTTNGFTRTGYTFTGWNTLANGTGTAYANGANYTMGVSGIAIYAEWSINSYTLTFESNGGSSVTAITQDFGTAISAPSAPTKSGYTFANWYNEVDLSTIHTFDTMGLTTTVYAKWTANTYTVTFNGNGSTGGSTATQSLVYNTATALTTNGFTKTCSSFAGWATTSGGAVDYANGASYTIGAGNVTLYAKWTATPDCYTLRSTGPGGGFVFYTTDGGLHGLEAAPAPDQSTGIIWAITANQSISVPGTSTAIGTGSANTDLIIAQNGAGITYAAGIARAYTNNGKSGWFLPSKDELNKMYINLNKGTDEYGVTYTPVGGFPSNGYWSSSEVDSGNAWRQSFVNSNQISLNKSTTTYVRAVRAF